MLHGLLTIKNEKFNDIFTTSFSLIANEILQNKIIKISDHLGSSIFIIKSQNFKKRISKETKIKTYACNNCKDSKFKQDRCILIKSTFLETGNISAASRKLGVSRTTIYKHLS
jgi:transcriptional regulator of acetoin/glycerol metabolism